MCYSYKKNNKYHNKGRLNASSFYALGGTPTLCFLCCIISV